MPRLGQRLLEEGGTMKSRKRVGSAFAALVVVGAFVAPSAQGGPQLVTATTITCPTLGHSGNVGSTSVNVHVLGVPTTGGSVTASVDSSGMHCTYAGRAAVASITFPAPNASCAVAGGATGSAFTCGGSAGTIHCPQFTSNDSIEDPAWKVAHGVGGMTLFASPTTLTCQVEAPNYKDMRTVPTLAVATRPLGTFSSCQVAADQHSFSCSTAPKP
jgi:hypothetical protein